MKKTILSEQLSRRLKNYGLSAGALVAGATTMDAQVMYTDVVPNDTASSSATDSILIDLNNDGTDDFLIDAGLFLGGTAGSFLIGTMNVKALGQNGIAASTVVVGTNTTYRYPYVIPEDTLIGPGMNFENNGGAAQTMAFGLYYPGGSQIPGYQYGNWAGAHTDKYLGLKLVVGGSSYFGWARFDVNPTRAILKDFAYQSTPGTPIAAGELSPALPALNVTIADAADNGDGSDLKVTFDPAANENTVQEYRIMIVKADQASSFNLASAQAVPSTRFTSVNPTGAPVSMTLAPGALGANGDPIEEGVEYVAFIFSKASATTNGTDALSAHSNAVTLTSSNVGIVDVAGNAGFYFTNPANGQLTIIRKEAAKEAVAMELYDISGRMVESRSFTGQSETFNLATGTYVVRVTEGMKTTSFPVVVK